MISLLESIALMKKTAAAALLGLILLFPAGCTQKQQAAPPPPPKVTVSQPLRENIVDYLELTAIRRQSTPSSSARA